MEGTIKPYPGFNAESDAKQLRDAMKGLGTNEKAIIEVLGARSCAQRVEIVRVFKTMYGKDLINDLKSELSGKFETVCESLCMPLDHFDAFWLHRAVEGAGTDEQGLIEILCTRTNAEMAALKKAYKFLYKSDLEKDIAKETSYNFERLLISLLQANRDDGNEVDHAKVRQDANDLFQAGDKKAGTDESTFNRIFCLRNPVHLNAVFKAFQGIAGRDIEESLKSELSGDILTSMLTIVRFAKDRPYVFAKFLHDAMAGAGTRDSSLIRIIVARCEIDMVQIKESFKQHYGKTLEEWIKGDTSGDYKKILLKLIGSAA